MNDRKLTEGALPSLLTRKEVAEYLRCSTRTVRRRKIPITYIGGLVRYNRDDVLALIKPEGGR